MAIRPESVYNIIFKNTVQLGLFQFETNPQVQHSRRATITQEYTELGFPISDNRITNPIELRIEGLISNTPANPNLTLFNIATGSLPSEIPFSQQLQRFINTYGEFAPFFFTSRRATAWHALLALQEFGNPFTVNTSLRVYPSMVITDLIATEREDNGNVLDVQVTCQEWRVVRTSGSPVADPIYEEATPLAFRGNPFINLGIRSIPTPGTNVSEAVTEQIGGLIAL